MVGYFRNLPNCVEILTKGIARYRGVLLHEYFAWKPCLLGRFTQPGTGHIISLSQIAITRSVNICRIFNACLFYFYIYIYFFLIHHHHYYAAIHFIQF